MAKRKRTNHKQRSTKHTHNTKDRATRTLLKTEVELRCSGRVSSSCSTSDTHRVTDKRHKHHLTWKPCWTPVCVNKYTKTFNKTRTPYITNGSKEESNIIFM